MKKAITPLISTVFLLVFAVGLGTLVMSWGNAQTQPHICESVSLDITNLQGTEQVCYMPGNLQTTLENNGNAQIDSIELVVLSTDGIKKSLIEQKIPPGEFSSISFPITLDLSKILKIRLIPNTNTESCVAKNIETEKLENCQNA